MRNKIDIPLSLMIFSEIPSFLLIWQTEQSFSSEVILLISAKEARDTICLFIVEFSLVFFRIYAAFSSLKMI